MTLPVIALDGPAASGKSSVGAAVAAALGLRFFDTGLLYRAMARAALDRAVDPADGPAVAALAGCLDVISGAAKTDVAGAAAAGRAASHGADAAPGDAARGGLAAAASAGAAAARSASVATATNGPARATRVLIDGRDVTDHLHTADVDRAVSAVARAPEVRRALLLRQRAIAAGGGIVVAGRDIGTVVLPDADAKVWLDATAERRAARRALERGLAQDSAEGVAILADLRHRDLVDGGRAVSPSRPAADAIHVHTDGNSLQDTVAAVLAAIGDRLSARSASAGPGTTP